MAGDPWPYGNQWPFWQQPCPTCGTCPTCGRRPADFQPPYWLAPVQIGPATGDPLSPPYQTTCLSGVS